MATMMMMAILSTGHLDVCPYMQCYTVLLAGQYNIALRDALPPLSNTCRSAMGSDSLVHVIAVEYKVRSVK